MIWKPMICLALLAFWTQVSAGASKREQIPIILDAASVANLALEFAEAEETTFEETMFALGHINVLPNKRAVVSSRIPGRAFSVLAVPHQQVQEGDEVAWIESRQPGDPPPTVMLAAPISGIVSKVDVALGQPVTPDQSLMEIIDLQVVEAEAQVPQHLANQLQLGQKAYIRVQALPGRVFEATLAHIAILADDQSGTIEAAFHVPNPESLLRPGMKAEFSIVTRQREDVMTIPRAAVQGDPSGRFVYIKDYEIENAFVKTPVVLGTQNDTVVEVVSGLLAGDEVVTRGAYALAFAGNGNISLKEALDAAHGHAHNEDGSEKADEHDDHAEHSESQEKSHGWTPLTTFFAGTSGLLLILLLVTVVMGRKNAVA
jgi:cobalt-zinc-cadmium efflux system membrane fusion protein